MSNIRKLIGIMLLVYVGICLPTYGLALWKSGFNIIIAFNFLLMAILGILVVHDLLQDHGPLEVIIEDLRKSDEKEEDNDE